jgi:hypothetical protein
VNEKQKIKKQNVRKSKKKIIRKEVTPPKDKTKKITYRNCI